MTPEEFAERKAKYAGELLSDRARVWLVRFDVPGTSTYKSSDGTMKTVPSTRHMDAYVATEFCHDAIRFVLRQWPEATVWAVNNQGRKCNVIVDALLMLNGRAEP